MSIQQLRDKILRFSEISKTHNASLVKFFSEMDINHSNEIDFNEFKLGLESIGLKSLSEESKIDLFSKFDKNKTGRICFNDFIVTLKPPLSNARVNVLEEAFKKLDENKDGVLSIEDFRVLYDNQAKVHPKCLCGEWTKDQVK